jgi:Dyp-type peroxidase family
MRRIRRMPDFLPDDQIDPNLQLDEIQGNVLAGFNKDHEALIFVRFGDTGPAQGWIGQLARRVATSKEVIAFNRLFRLVNDRRADQPDDTDTVQATWINVALTATGIRALDGATDGMDPSFLTGMAAQAGRLGDGDRAPREWVVGREAGEVDAVLIIASDRRDDLHRAIAHELKHLAAHGVVVTFVQEGHTRGDEPGHEHFGYKDGVSQPGLKGLHRPAPPPHDDQGDLGSDLLQIGEFVLGYATQPGVAEPPPPTDTYNPSTPQEPGGPPSRSGPDWTKNGSYYVFRRLMQDVPAFQEQIDAAARDLGVTSDEAGAIVIGRYKSGAPLEVTGRVAADPGLDDLSLVGDNINNFEYAGADADGHVVPHAAHIRKTYPRDSVTPGGGEADTQRHRLLRRGIPYGQSYHHGAPPSGPNGRDATFPLDRGLLFQCYGRSITDQFELVTELWVANKNFTEPDDGVDGVLSDGPMKVPPAHAITLQRFVTATGGEYFFSPSVSALQGLAGT